jgi:proteic killer suppression protein
MIKSFANKATEAIFHGANSKVARCIPIELHAIAARKLSRLSYAVSLNDLRTPPANHLEKLSGDWAGFYSIRINKQWRITFRWTEEGAESVEIVDYH